MRRIAAERIQMLLERARDEKDERRRKRYVELARRISMRCRVRIPCELKRWICKGCGTYMDADSCRVRVRGGKGLIITTCLKCGRIIRKPIE